MSCLCIPLIFFFLSYLVRREEIASDNGGQDERKEVQLVQHPGYVPFAGLNSNATRCRRKAHQIHVTKKQRMEKNKNAEEGEE